LTITSKLVNKFQSNLAHSISDKFLTMWHKSIHFTNGMYARYLTCWKHGARWRRHCGTAHAWWYGV